MAPRRPSRLKHQANRRGRAALDRRTFLKRGVASAAGALLSLTGFPAAASAEEKESPPGAGLEQLPKRRLGKTGLMVSVLAYGGAPLFEEVATPVPEETVARMLHRAMDLGLNLIDVSHFYGRGYSEKAFGKAVQGRRDKVVIFSRCPMGRGRSATEMLEESLQRLQTDYIDIYGLHGTWMSDDTADRFIETMLPELEKAKQAGKIRHIAGTAHQAPTAVVKMLRTGKVEVIQIPVNPLWREFLEVVIPVAKEEDVGVVAMKPLWRGRLLVSMPELDALLGSTQREKLTNCIGFGLLQDIASVSIGFVHEPEVDQDISAAVSFLARPGEKFTPDEAKRLRPKAHETVKDNCRVCNRCLPCPVRIDVPRVLRLELYARHYGLSDWAKSEYRRLRPKADQCTKCGACMERCPYSIRAQELVLRAAKELP